MVRVPPLERRFGGFALVLGREDGAAVLRADVVALAIELGRVMGAHKHVEDLLERNPVAVIGHAHALGMAGGSAAYLLVGRIGLVSADIAAFDPAHADDVLHHCLGAPEASACDDYLFLRHSILLYRFR